MALLLGAAGLGLLAAAAFALAPQMLRITRVAVTGNSLLGRDEVLAAALLPDPAWWFSVDPERVRTALLAEPRVADASVRRVFPNGVAIAVIERQAVAAVVIEMEGRSALARIDAEGVVFDLSAPRTAIVARSGEGLPGASPQPVTVLSGIRFEDFRTGTRLPPIFLPLLGSLEAIRRDEPGLLEAFSEIRVVRTRYGDLELLLYPLRQRMPVRTGSDLDGDTLRSIILVLDVLGSRLGPDSVEEIDFRAGTVVYRAKEGQSG